MAKYVDTKKKPFFYKVLRFFVRIFYKKREFFGLENISSEASIYISNHAQIHGPLSCEIFFPTKKYVWCIGQMMKMKEVPSYAYKDFWSNKPKSTRWFFKFLAYLIAPLSSYIFTRADTIGVYKDARIIKTYRETIERLEEGANIVIFPEKIGGYNHIVNEFQDKFVDVARLYYKKTGKLLRFVPMYNAAKLKKIVLGKAIVYDPNIEIAEQREIICKYLQEEITKLALELPKHKVIPYENIRKKERKYSK